ncbi:TPA: protein-L-isoaspartate(D-aspartate) O-methyltransferase [Candidatus Bathyarchaeota archaeon]|nr:protein-L-isoaspartate(D-aspartate) O-methyltransferase [Candidatus Bathyarchaeota archaeon]
MRKEGVLRYLIHGKIARSPEVIHSFLAVPREEFVPPTLRDHAYDDCPLPIGYGQTISAIHMVVIMNEALELKRGQKVLEIGAGSGYHAALVAEIVGREGHVFTIEIVPELVEFARENLKRTGYADRVTVIHGDGSVGYPKEAPYDRILVTAAAPGVPKPLLEQLKPEGIMVIPAGTIYLGQQLLKIRKAADGSITEEDLGSVAFVPLRGKEGWRL